MPPPLLGVPATVGRLVGFSPGWFENQSIWLHMSYKFYLELLKGSLYTEFFEEIRTGVVAFMDPEVYGRSPLEVSSFIVSSVFPDDRMHGKVCHSCLFSSLLLSISQGMLARLSGSTAEFLSMWNIMMAGHQPFVLSFIPPSPFSPLDHHHHHGVNQSQCAILGLRPILPAWLFDPQTKSLSFVFLGTIKVTYKNLQLIDTWNATHFTGVAYTKDGLRSFVTTSGHHIAASPFPTVKSSLSELTREQEYFDCDLAELARSGRISLIEITIEA
jgi:hypothetical protein